ncbi:hypothetical protein KA013_04665 [Patescibacteria group bacterium]|nr:hypothetical protein [Patescibacteria group bacterium]
MCDIIYYDFNVNAYKILITMMTIIYFIVLTVIAVFLLHRGHRQCHESFHTNVGFRAEEYQQRRDRESRKKKRQQAYMMIGGGFILLLLALLAVSQVVDNAYRETLYISIGGIIAGTIIFYPFRRLVSYYSKGFKLSEMRPAQTWGFIIMLLSGLAFFVIVINQLVFGL